MTIKAPLRQLSATCSGFSSCGATTVVDRASTLRGLRGRERKWVFDRWCYAMEYGRWGAGSSAAAAPSYDYANGRLCVAVEGLKFAFNAWLLLRTSAFFDLTEPSVVNTVTATTPSMDIAKGGNRIWHTHVSSGVGRLDPRRVTVALTPAHDAAVNVAAFDWRTAAAAAPDGLQIVCGHENGLSDELRAACDHCVTIPQYGSVGSLSMNNAIGVAVHHATAALSPDIDIEPASDHDRGGAALLPSNAVPSRAAAAAATLSSDPYCVSGVRHRRPHTDDLVDLPDAEVAAVLAARRAALPMQLAVVWQNLTADRNIGATLRSANAYNVEAFLVIGRRKFNRRGAIGTHKYTPFDIRPEWDDVCEARLAGYELWGLWNDRPVVADTLTTEMGPEFGDWNALCKRLNCQRQNEPSSELRAFYLSHPVALQRAMHDARARGSRGVALVVPEDGTSLTPEMTARCHRLVRITSHRNTAAAAPGLAPAVAATIALERLRSASLELPWVV